MPTTAGVFERAGVHGNAGRVQHVGCGPGSQWCHNIEQSDTAEGHPQCLSKSRFQFDQLELRKFPNQDKPWLREPPAFAFCTNLLSHLVRWEHRSARIHQAMPDHVPPWTLLRWSHYSSSLPLAALQLQDGFHHRLRAPQLHLLGGQLTYKPRGYVSSLPTLGSNSQPKLLLAWVCLLQPRPS